MSLLEEIFNGVINGLRGSLGSYGELVFEVWRGGLHLGDIFRDKTVVSEGDALKILTSLNDTRVMTFNDLQRRTRARTATHDLINRQSVTEFIGEDAETISLDIKLVRQLGVNPEEEARRVRDYVKSGYVDYLIIGGEVIGDGQWLITDVQEKLRIVDCFGRIVVSELALDFQSYGVTEDGDL